VAHPAAPPWPCLRPQGAGAVLDVAAVPGARRTGADGLHDGALRVRLLLPPVDGKANDALLGWLSAELGLPRRAFTLLRGAASRRKTIAIAAPPAVVAAWLRQVLGDAPAAGRAPHDRR